MQKDGEPVWDHGDSEVEGAAHERGFYRAGKFDMKIFRQAESVGERKIDKPAAIEEISAMAALRPHNCLTL